MIKMKFYNFEHKKPVDIKQKTPKSLKISKNTTKLKPSEIKGIQNI